MVYDDIYAMISLVFDGSIYDIIGWVPTDVRTWNCQPKLGNWCCESSKHELFPPVSESAHPPGAIL